MFRYAIVKRPSKSLVDGITGNADYGIPDYNKAVKQHDRYIEALKKCNVEVEILEASENYPDSCFVEDVAVVTKNFALITNPGADSRNGEIKDIIPVLKKYRENLEYIKVPGTLEGGDVMMVDDHFYIGLSKRTNREGAEQFIQYLEKYGLSGSIVPVKGILHLKTGMSYIEGNNLLITHTYTENPSFDSFNLILIEDADSYSSNCIWINDHVIVPAGYEKNAKKIADLGYTVHEVEMSEYMKLDGGLSCLSLRF